MHVYFSGIGGSGISGLALIAKQAGYDVSGSDAQDSTYIKYLSGQGISDIHIGQSLDQIAKVHEKKPIDWYVYSSALPKTNPNHPELLFCRQNGIKISKRDEFLGKLIADKQFKLIAIAGTHGKSTTSAMAVWLFMQLGEPVSYLLGAKIGFNELAKLDSKSRYFIYEADEYDRNFLSFHPRLSVISGIDWDHPDIYPSRESYNEAFRQFLGQSREAVIWQNDLRRLDYHTDNLMVLDDSEPQIDLKLTLAGLVNRKNAWLVAMAAAHLTRQPLDDLIEHLNNFPGLSRRFEQIAPRLYSDYAHTPPKIRGALQLAQEVAGNNVVVVYEGLHNTRQHFIKDDLANLFDDVKQLYIVPSFLAREDKKLKLLTPDDLLELLSDRSKSRAQAGQLNGALAQKIRDHLNHGDLVLCLSAGSGPQSLDDWLRQEFSK